MSNRKYGFTMLDFLIVASVVVSIITYATIHISHKYQNIVPKETVSQQHTEEPMCIKDFGNGVRYFPFTGEKFGRKLSEFLGSHTNLEDKVAIPDDAGSYGMIKGYFITFREKK